ncbi:MAG: hypothetical protein VX220_00600 [Pseudomonadota bacterium]|nr:hypothetical protein [Pseudomonadota bacterium]
MAVTEVYPTTQLLQIPDSIFHAYDIRSEVDKMQNFESIRIIIQAIPRRVEADGGQRLQATKDQFKALIHKADKHAGVSPPE